MAESAGITWPGSSPPACLVSGASGGLGRAVAERLAAAGGMVVITSRDPGRAAATAAGLAGAGDIRARRSEHPRIVNVASGAGSHGDT